jgi:ribonuclease P protein component
LVVHLLLSDEPAQASVARAGFVVSKAVGNAVVRNKVRRRLRHLVRPLLADLPASASLVVRALPSAASASFTDLAADLESALTAARSPRRRR